MSNKQVIGNINITGDISVGNINILNNIYKTSTSVAELYNFDYWNKIGDDILYTQSNILTSTINSINITTSVLLVDYFTIGNLTLKNISNNDIITQNITSSSFNSINISAGELIGNLCLGLEFDISNITSNKGVFNSIYCDDITSIQFTGTDIKVDFLTSGNIIVDNVILENNGIKATNITVNNLNVTSIETHFKNSILLTTGNINVSGNIYKNNVPYIFSNWNQNQNNIDYTVGNIGINTSNPQYNLDINGILSTTTLIPNYIISKLDNTDISIYANNIGIGVSSPNYKLHVNGDVFGTSVISSSDIRLKKNILPIKEIGNTICKISGVYYTYKNQNSESKTRNIGFIAQDIEKTIPESVENRDVYKGVKYNNITVLLIETLKNLSKRVEYLKQKLN